MLERRTRDLPYQFACDPILARRRVRDGAAWRADRRESGPAPAGSIRARPTTARDTSKPPAGEKNEADGAGTATTGSKDPDTAAPEPEPELGQLNRRNGPGTRQPRHGASPQTDADQPGSRDRRNVRAVGRRPGTEVVVTESPEVTPATHPDPATVEPFVGEPFRVQPQVAGGKDAAPRQPAAAPPTADRPTGAALAPSVPARPDTIAPDTAKNGPASVATADRHEGSSRSPRRAHQNRCPHRRTAGAARPSSTPCWRSSASPHPGRQQEPVYLGAHHRSAVPRCSAASSGFSLDRTPAVQPVVPARPTPVRRRRHRRWPSSQRRGGGSTSSVACPAAWFRSPSTDSRWRPPTSSPVGRQVWVTPERQIIAYQRHDRGTNLLFKPIMVLSQLLTDLR